MPVRLFAAGSLKAAMGDLAVLFEGAGGGAVETIFGAAGLLRRRIEAGEGADLFASANLDHPQALASRGGWGPVQPFARNRLCAIVRPGLAATAETLLEAMLDPGVRLGTSTPGADPSGDYTWEMFRRAEALRPGAFAALDAKALKLSGGPDTDKAPEGWNQYAWIMHEGRADVFLTYRTNAAVARQQLPALQIVPLPAALAVEAVYGLTVRDGAPRPAGELARFILSAPGRGILSGYGFACTPRSSGDA